MRSTRIIGLSDAGELCVSVFVFVFVLVLVPDVFVAFLCLGGLGCRDTNCLITALEHASSKSNLGMSSSSRSSQLSAIGAEGKER